MKDDTYKVVNTYPAYDGPEPFLQCTYRENPCGCKITGNGTLQHPLTIQHCAMHAATKANRLAADVELDTQQTEQLIRERKYTVGTPDGYVTIRLAPVDEREELLRKAADAQSAYWNSLHELEEALGVEVDGTRDLEGLTVEDLKPEDDDEADREADAREEREQAERTKDALEF